MDLIFPESMISSSFKHHLEHVLGCPITRFEPVSGGDISKAFCIYTATNRFFSKINQSDLAKEMFLTEKLSLDSINQTNTIKAPEVIHLGQHHDGSYIIMEYVESKSPSSKEMEAFGHQLAAMHKYEIGSSFGREQDNFIGTLQQSNKKHSDWVQFYVGERLLPQLRLARSKELLSSNEIPKEIGLLKGCERLFPKIKPSLIHGDLWSGNYLINNEGVPFLIDPALYVGHYEVDMSMTQLFGGFSSPFYKAYETHFPKEILHNERKDIYQLYYLLVHLNLFGKSYSQAVKQLLKIYFN
ncbi:fructosamine kinase family protein [Maribacter sp. HTCC2170]|uniref:fructosamine kinase family protein n=1 Tax=Maribacter sp. (strain HTCC2170 / KCCM 42371) TaxID=313603 RepID=UPI00006BD474|nr:fructosamine kinase family protein [Maribacter sp. HTCC2170]EAR02829.1 hypothetical protein FB2170_06060 [Maribacter sp. HTCC2170]